MKLHRWLDHIFMKLYKRLNHIKTLVWTQGRQFWLLPFFNYPSCLKSLMKICVRLITSKPHQIHETSQVARSYQKYVLRTRTTTLAITVLNYPTCQKSLCCNAESLYPAKPYGYIFMKQYRWLNHIANKEDNFGYQAGAFLFDGHFSSFLSSSRGLL